MQGRGERFMCSDSNHARRQTRTLTRRAHATAIWPVPHSYPHGVQLQRCAGVTTHPSIAHQCRTAARVAPVSMVSVRSISVFSCSAGRAGLMRACVCERGQSLQRAVCPTGMLYTPLCGVRTRPLVSKARRGARARPRYSLQYSCTQYRLQFYNYM